jgi:hypothetical protein
MSNTPQSFDGAEEAVQYFRCAGHDHAETLLSCWLQTRPGDRVMCTHTCSSAMQLKLCYADASC